MTRKTLLCCLVCVLLWPACAGRCQSLDEVVAGTIRSKLEESEGIAELNVSGCRVSSLVVIPELYKRRNYQPIWTNAASVEQLVGAVGETYLEGLDPDDYHLRDIERLQGLIDAGTPADPKVAAALDLLLTDAFIRLVYHSICGKEDPVTYHPQWNLARDIDDKDPVQFMEDMITSKSVGQRIREAKIQHPYYERLKRALAEYRTLRSVGGWNTVPGGPALKKGMIDPRVADIRKRLAVTGDLSGTSTDPMTFDGALEQALMRFQTRHGLKADGVAGKGTIEAMNVPVDDRIDQIRVNLERARWMLHDLDDRFVLVDIAGFRVLFYQGDKVTWSCRAQVGQPYRDTPVFRSAIQHIEFNPAWIVPPGIFKKDVLPGVLKNPRYLREKDLSVIDSRGAVVDPRTIVWRQYLNKPFPYRLRQNPGENSALGRIKIYFPNEYLVYLHDTPSKALFEEQDRAFSSGCIRVEKPFELAELLLDDPVRWDLGKIIQAAESGKNQKVPLPRYISILLMYWTVEVDEGGTVHFKKDPYGRDGPVLEGLGRDAGIRPMMRAGNLTPMPMGAQ